MTDRERPPWRTDFENAPKRHLMCFETIDNALLIGAIYGDEVWEHRRKGRHLTIRAMSRFCDCIPPFPDKDAANE